MFYLYIVQYLKSISENVAGGTSLTSVYATDIDSGMNKKIKYSISNVTTVGIVEETDEEVRMNNYTENALIVTHCSLL